MKHIFIINPAAGSRDRTKEYTQTIDAVCSAKGIDYQIAVSACPGDCTRLAKEAAATGEEVRLYACGGDGTLNEVVCGAAGYPNASVTVFSGGSGNDFVKLFDKPEAFTDLEQLLDCEEVNFDLIRCNDRLCLNICSVGLDARIGIDVAKYKRIPLLHGFRAYVFSTIVNVIKGIYEHYVVKIGDECIDAQQTMICACNGRFYGGGFNPVPEADPTDGLLDVLLAKKVSRLQVPAVVGKYKNGQYVNLPKLIRHLKTSALTILCDKPTPIQIDGESMVAQEINISMADQTMRFFYPKGLVWQAKAPQSV